MCFARVSRENSIELVLRLVPLGRFLVSGHSYIRWIYLRGTAKTQQDLQQIQFGLLVTICYYTPLQSVKRWPQAKQNKRIKAHSKVYVFITCYPYVFNLFPEPKYLRNKLAVRMTIEYTFKDHNLIQFHLLEVATNFSDPKQFITFSRGFLTFFASYNILF